jgi:hypothetical protein
LRKCNAEGGPQASFRILGRRKDLNMGQSKPIKRTITTVQMKPKLSAWDQLPKTVLRVRTPLLGHLAPPFHRFRIVMSDALLSPGTP